MNRSRISRIFLAVVAGAFAAGTTHVVVKGDTLWDITGKYLGNPFTWPTVWQKNPQIKDAHWIYPGDVVNIDGSGDGSGASNGASAANGEASAANPQAVNDPLAGFAENPDNQKMVVVDTVAAALELVIPPTQSVLSMETVLKAPVLYPPDQQAPAPQSEIVYDEDYGHHQLMPGFIVETKIGSEQGVKMGDRMAIVERDDMVATNVMPNIRGRLEETRALADVIEVRKKTSLLRLVAVFGQVGVGAKVRPYVAPSAASVTAFEDFKDAAPATVVVNNRLGRVQMPGTDVIINRGEADGVGQGDIYEFMDGTKDRGLAAMRGYGLVVRTTRTTSTIQIVGATPKAILIGDKAWRVRRSVRG